MSEIWLSTGEAARQLGVNSKTVNIWCHTGAIECIVTPGGHHRVRQSAVDARLAARSKPKAQGGILPAGQVLVESDPRETFIPDRAPAAVDLTDRAEHCS